jgi:hypothetical protein
MNGATAAGAQVPQAPSSQAEFHVGGSKSNARLRRGMIVINRFGKTGRVEAFRLGVYLYRYKWNSDCRPRMLDMGDDDPRLRWHPLHVAYQCAAARCSRLDLFAVLNSRGTSDVLRRPVEPAAQMGHSDCVNECRWSILPPTKSAPNEVAFASASHT